MFRLFNQRRQWQPTPVLLPGKSHGWRSLVGCSPWGHEELDTTERLHFHFHFHALEKEMATHSSVLAWRIPGMGEPGGLPSMRSHRVGHDWSDLAAAADCLKDIFLDIQDHFLLKECALLNTQTLRIQIKHTINASACACNLSHLVAQLCVVQLCPILCDPVDCSPLGYSAHGIF